MKDDSGTIDLDDLDAADSTSNADARAAKADAAADLDAFDETMARIHDAFARIAALDALDDARLNFN